MSATFPELPPANPAVDDPGHTDDHGKLVGALEYVRDNMLPGVVSDTEPAGLPFGHLWVKPRRAAGAAEVLLTKLQALPSGASSLTMDVDVPAGTSALFLATYWTPQAPAGTPTMNGTALEQYGTTASSGSTSTDRAVALWVVPSPPIGAVSFVFASAAAIARGLAAVCVGGTNPDNPAGPPVIDAGTGRTGSRLTPDALPFLRFGIGRGAPAMTYVGDGAELDQIASGSTTRIAAGWQPTGGGLTAGGWDLAAADAAAAIGCAVVPA